jgi:hypothetical protein
MVASQTLAKTIRERLEIADVKVADPLLRSLVPGVKSVGPRLVSGALEEPGVYKSWLQGIEGIEHLAGRGVSVPEHAPVASS